MNNQRIFIGSLIILGLLLINGDLLYGQHPPSASIVIAPPQIHAEATSTMAMLVPPALPPAASSFSVETTVPTVGTPTATPSIITVNTPTAITVTVQIVDPTLLPGGVNLLRLNSNGTAAVLGVMHDDGLNGDAAANDHIYTLLVLFNETTTGQAQLQVSAAFKGQLKRITSNSLPISIDNAYTNATVGVTVAYPSGTYLAPPVAGPATVQLQSTPDYLTLGETFGPIPEGSSVATDGYLVKISSSPFTAPFDVYQWLATKFPDYAVATVSPVTIQGISAYDVSFQDVTGIRALYLIPRGMTVYTIIYDSDYDDGSSQEAAAEAILNQILNNIQFLT